MIDFKKATLSGLNLTLELFPCRLRSTKKRTPVTKNTKKQHVKAKKTNIKYFTLIIYCYKDKK